MEVKSRLSITTGSESPINHVKLQPSTNYAVIAQDSTLKLFNIQTNRLIQTYQSHVDLKNRSINSFDFIFSDESRMQIVSVSKSIQIHDINKPDFPIRWFHDSDTSYSKFFKINDIKTLNCDVIASCDENRSVKLYDLRQSSKYKPIQEFQDSKDSLNSIDYSCFRIFAGSNDGGLYTYDLRMGLLIRDELSHPITCVKVQKDKAVLSQLNDSVKVFDLNSNGIICSMDKTPNDQEYQIDCGFFNDNWIISGSETGEIYYKDYLNLKKKGRLVLYGEKDHRTSVINKHGKIVSGLDVDGERIVTGTGGGELNVVHLNDK